MSSVAADDRIAQRRVRGHQRPEQEAGHPREARHPSDGNPSGHSDQKDQQAVDEGAALDPVELLQVDLQPHREQQIDSSQIREQPHRLAVGVHPLQSMGADQHARQQQTDQIRQAEASDQGRHGRTDRHQQSEHPKGVVHYVADRGLHRHGLMAEPGKSRSSMVTGPTAGNGFFRKRKPVPRPAPATSSCKRRRGRADHRGGPARRCVPAPSPRCDRHAGSCSGDGRSQGSCDHG